MIFHLFSSQMFILILCFSKGTLRGRSTLVDLGLCVSIFGPSLARLPIWNFYVSTEMYSLSFGQFETHCYSPFPKVCGLSCQPSEWIFIAAFLFWQASVVLDEIMAGSTVSHHFWIQLATRPPSRLGLLVPLPLSPPRAVSSYVYGAKHSGVK